MFPLSVTARGRPFFCVFVSLSPLSSPISFHLGITRTFFALSSCFV